MKEKKKKDKLDVLKSKKLLCIKGHCQRRKMTTPKQEKFASHISHKVLITVICKECLQVNNKKDNPN